jgi:hypothetical protein
VRTSRPHACSFTVPAFEAATHACVPHLHVVHTSGSHSLAALRQGQFLAVLQPPLHLQPGNTLPQRMPLQAHHFSQKPCSSAKPGL